jgi:neutral ceramidase
VGLLAGIGRSIITPRVGVKLIGYFNRPGPSNGVHDDLHARALVLDDGQTALALCSVEILWLRTQEIEQIRQAVSARCGLQPGNIFIFCTHTHSGPAPFDPDGWERPVADFIADAIVEAYESRQPARLGTGFGHLFGYSINRRWLDRPIDPAVGVIRVDLADGSPLAVLGNYACHAVVMGYDNLLISGDWPGYASRQLESELGALALFGQGGAGDVNPLTETVRQRLAAGHPVSGIGALTTYYGPHGVKSPDWWNIEDRGGGMFIEAETIARAYCAEVMRVWRGIQTEADVPLWVERITVDGRVGADEPPAEGLSPEHRGLLPVDTLDRMEVMLVGIGGAVLASQPGETFGETAVEFRKTCQQMGYAYPMMISYANGTYAYLPPANAFLEGGYEVSWPLKLGVSRHLQERITAAMYPILESHLGN